MASKNTIEILIKANTAQAVGALNKLQTGIAKPFANIRKQTAGLSDAFQGITGVSLSTAGAFAAVGMAVNKLSDFIKTSVTETVAYAQSVRELSYVLGTNAEETSRLIQVADDYLISVDRLSTALRFAVKNGFEPTVESLAQLADEFNAIQDPNERAAKMVEIFGRNWSALVPLLKAGGAAIRENAAAINENLLMNEQQLAATREYEIALDNLGDSIDAVKTSVGMSLVPALNDALGAINQLTPALSLLDDVFGQNVISAYSLVAALTLLKGIKFGEDISLANFAKNAQELNAAIEAIPNPAERTASELQGMVRAGEEVVQEFTKADDVLKDFANSLAKSGKFSANQLVQQVDALAAAIGNADASTVIYSQDLQLLNDAVAAGVMSQERAIPLYADAADGIFELDKKTRDYIDGALAAQEAASEFGSALDGASNSATALRDQLASTIGLAEQLRFTGPREVRNQIFDQLQQLLSQADPSKASALASGIEDIGLAFGKFNANDLAIAEAIPQFVEQLGALRIDPSQFAEAVQSFLDAVRNTRMTGEPMDVSSILEQFMPTKEQVSALAEEYKDIWPSVEESIQPMMDLNVGETVALPVQQTAEAVGLLRDNSAPAAESMGLLATNALLAGTNSSAAVGPVSSLYNVMKLLSSAAGDAAGNLRSVVGAIQGVIGSALTAIGIVQRLAGAINALPSGKTITINIVVNGAIPNFDNLGGGTFTFNFEGAPKAGGTTRGQAKKGRALGGPVNALQPYLVGEKGPELLIPQTAGTILPANLTQAAIMAIGTAGKKQRQFMGMNFDAYLQLFQPNTSLSPGIRKPALPPQPSVPQPKPKQKKARSGGWGPLTDEEWEDMNSQATEALSNTLTNTYQPVSFGGNIPGNIAGVVGLNEGINESDAKQLQTPGGVVNNFFPITKVEDELDARKLARLVAAELARMPSR